MLCPVGSACLGSGVTLASLPLKPGYYRTDNASNDLRRCPDAAGNTSGCVGGVGEDGGEGPCREWLRGPYCRLCNVTDTSRYYNSEESACVLCEGNAAAPLLIGIFCVLAVIVFSLVWARFQPHRKVRALAKLSARLVRVSKQLSLRAKGKQLLSLYQVATRISGVFDVPMPASVANLLSVFELFNLNIGGIGLPLQCMSLGTYEQQLATTMLAPLAVAALLLIGFLLHSCCRGKGVGAGLLAALPWLLSLSFIVFPMVSSSSFRAFACEDFDTGRAYLVADYSVECSTAGHTSNLHERAKSLAFLGIGLYPCGISLLYVVLLLRARRALVDEKPTALSKALGFLVRDCKPHHLQGPLLHRF